MKRFMPIVVLGLCACSAEQQGNVADALFAPSPIDGDYSKHLEAQRQSTIYQPVGETRVKPAGALLKHQYVEGLSRICIYDNIGSPFILTVNAVALCPI